MENTIVTVTPYLPYIAAALPYIFGIIALAVQGRLHGFIRETVAAVYRVAIHAASTLEDEGIAWLKSEAGIAYRRHLAEEAYDLLPARIGPVPVGLVKLVVSREAWCDMVESAFAEVVKLADRLELPEELPTA